MNTDKVSKQNEEHGRSTRNATASVTQIIITLQKRQTKRCANNQQQITFHTPGVSGVLLESKAQDGQLLAGNGVEHGAHNVVRETVLLVVVHEHDLGTQGIGRKKEGDG